MSRKNTSTAKSAKSAPKTAKKAAPAEKKEKKVTLNTYLKADAEMNKIDTRFQFARWKNREKGLKVALREAAKAVTAWGEKQGGAAQKKAEKYLELRSTLNVKVRDFQTRDRSEASSWGCIGMKSEAEKAATKDTKKASKAKTVAAKAVKTSKGKGRGRKAAATA